MPSENVISIHFENIETADFNRVEKFENDSVSYDGLCQKFALNSDSIIGNILHYKNYSNDRDSHNMEMEIDFPELPKNERPYLLDFIGEIIQKNYNLSCHLYLGRKNSSSQQYDFCV